MTSTQVELAKLEEAKCKNAQCSAQGGSKVREWEGLGGKWAWKGGLGTSGAAESRGGTDLFPNGLELENANHRKRAQAGVNSRKPEEWDYSARGCHERRHLLQGHSLKRPKKGELRAPSCVLSFHCPLSQAQAGMGVCLFPRGVSSLPLSSFSDWGQGWKTSPVPAVVGLMG